MLQHMTDKIDDDDWMNAAEPASETGEDEMLALSFDGLKAMFNGKIATRARKGQFLEFYRRTALKGWSANKADVTHESVLDWERRDPYFKRAVKVAEQLAIDDAEMEARTRAIEGTEEVVLNRGEVVWRRDPKDPTQFLLDGNGERVPLTRRIKSDRLLELILAGRRSEVYGKKTSDVNVNLAPAGDYNELPEQVDFKKLSPEKRALVRQLLEMPDEVIAKAVDGDKNAF